MCSSTPSKPAARARAAASPNCATMRVEVVEREVVDRLPPARARDLQEVDDLRHDLATGPASWMRAHELAEAGDELVAEMRSSGPDSAAVHRHRLDDDEPRAALGEAHGSASTMSSLTRPSSPERRVTIAGTTTRLATSIVPSRSGLKRVDGGAIALIAPLAA